MGIRAKFQFRTKICYYIKKNFGPKYAHIFENWGCAKPKTVKISDTHKTSILNFFQNFFFGNFFSVIYIVNQILMNFLYDNFHNFPVMLMYKQFYVFVSFHSQRNAGLFVKKMKMMNRAKKFLKVTRKCALLKKTPKLFNNTNAI